MNEPLQNELVELCMLLILQEKPVSGLEMILELDKHMGLENVLNEHCFSDLREKGYGSLIFEKVDGERRGHVSHDAKRSRPFVGRFGARGISNAVMSIAV